MKRELHFYYSYLNLIAAKACARLTRVHGGQRRNRGSETSSDKLNGERGEGEI